MLQQGTRPLGKADSRRQRSDDTGSTAACNDHVRPSHTSRQKESRSKKRKINAFVMVWGGPQPPLLLKAACSQLSTSHVWELTAGLRPLSG